MVSVKEAYLRCSIPLCAQIYVKQTAASSKAWRESCETPQLFVYCATNVTTRVQRVGFQEPQTPARMIFSRAPNLYLFHTICKRTDFKHNLRANMC